MNTTTLQVRVHARTTWAQFIIHTAKLLLRVHPTLARLWLRSVGRLCLIAIHVEGSYHRFGPRRLRRWLRVRRWSYIRIRFDVNLEPSAEAV